MFDDLRYAVRMLMKSPGFTAVAVLTLGLGIGATTAIYSAVNALILNPLPMTRADRLMQIGETRVLPDGKTQFGGVSAPSLQAIRAEQDTFLEMGWFEQTHLNRQTEDFVDQMMGYAVSPNFFRLLQAVPLHGRTFTDNEGELETDLVATRGDSVIVLGHATWMRLYAGDPMAIGRTIELSDRRFTIIGVMGPEIRFPVQAGFWLPSRDQRISADVTSAPNCKVIVRLKDDATPASTQVLLDTLAQRVKAAHGNAGQRGYGMFWGAGKGPALTVRPLRLMLADYGQDLRQTLVALLGAVGFILLIVCANVANLALARAEARHQEFAVRVAVGASRMRIVRQLLTENVLLACLGGLCGLLVANWGIALMAGLIPDFMPRLRPIAMDRSVLAFSTVVSVATGLFFGLAPAWTVGRVRDIHESLKQCGLNATAGMRGRWFRGSVIVTQIALTVVLMAGAGLMIQSVVRMLRTDPGFKPDGLVRVYIGLPSQKYAPPDKLPLKNAVLAEIHSRIAALPGVTVAGIGRDADEPGEIVIADRTEPEAERVNRQACGVGESDLFRALGAPILAGRAFEAADIGTGRDAVIINQQMARMFWPEQDPIGKTFRWDRGRVTYRIVGVVGDLLTNSYTEAVRPVFYRPYHDFYLFGPIPYLVARTQGDPTVLIKPIRKELIAAEAEMHTPSIAVMSDVLYRSTQAQRTYMLYLLAFAATGVLLSAIGIYGLLSYSIVRRTREIGIRMAMGAQRRDVLRMVMAGGMKLVLIGAACGLIAAGWMTRFIQNQLHGVSATDPVVMVVVVLSLLAVALLACFIPAHRASRVDPMVALRAE